MRPLEGVRIVDLTGFLSGPFCTQILGDLGADVVKVEPPEGDLSRTIPPYFVGEDSAYYLANNRNKRSIAIDLSTREGQHLTRALIARSDVVVENYRPGVCRRLGLDSDALRCENPGLVWASISGFGQDSPWRDRPAYDMIVQALSGVMSLTGEPNRPSVRLGIPAGDLVAGLYTAIGVLGALIKRGKTGHGSTLDISMLDCQLAMLSYQAAYALVGGATPGPQGSRHDSIPTYRTFVAADGRDVAVTANTQRMWRALCEVLGRAELVDDPRFLDGDLRLQHAGELWAHLEQAFLERPAAAWVELLNAQGVPAGLITTVPEALSAARSAGRSMIVELESPDGQSVDVVGNPVAFPGEERPVFRYPPRLGEDAAAVLQEYLGMTAEQVEALHCSGVLGQSKRTGQ